MDKAKITEVIEHYIKAYNNFDVEAMVENMHPEEEFENIAGDQVTLSIKGIENFRKQASEATSYFTQREQRITHWEIEAAQATVRIDYEGTLAIDLPNGLKAGDKLALKGKSVFTFQDDQIIRLQDYS